MNKFFSWFVGVLIMVSTIIIGYMVGLGCVVPFMEAFL